MSIREEMGKLRREYRTEASRLDQQLDELGERTEAGFTRVGVQMRTAQEQIRRLHDQMADVHDQFGAVVESIEQVKADHQEQFRTMRGRSRLLEDRVGKMLDLVESAVEEPATRKDLEALEKKLESAA